MPETKKKAKNTEYIKLHIALNRLKLSLFAFIINRIQQPMAKGIIISIIIQISRQ